jgi:beta-galactosidase
VALAGRVDVVGLNDYSRAFIAPAPGLLDNLEALPCLAALSCGDRTGVDGDNGNEVYPYGLYEALREFSAYGLPMAVSENGVSDADDDLRPSYLVMHLMQVHRAIGEGLDVRAYLHWSLLDNYEWTSGYDQKFGLHAVDYATLARTARPSAGLYRDIVTGNGLTAAQVGRWDLPGINPMQGAAAH